MILRWFEDQGQHFNASQCKFLDLNQKQPIIYHWEQPTLGAK